MKRIGVDLDGVTASFIGAFYQIANSMFGTELGPPQMTWELEGELTREQIDLVWERIKGTKDFWQTLKPEEGVSRLSYPMPKGVELVFVTSRIPTAGHTVREQSCQWLREQFHITHPFVIVADEPAAKIPIVRALNVQAFIEDKRSTIEEMNAAGVRSYARLQGYNAQTPFPEGVIPVADLNEYLELETKVGARE